MPPIRARRIILTAIPRGNVVESDFRVEQIAVPEPMPGELLLETEYISLDPYMRGRMGDRKTYYHPMAVGSTIDAWGTGIVLKSRHPSFAEGDVVVAQTGWQSHSVVAGDGEVRRINHGTISHTTALGILGYPGFTAYVGIMHIAKPKAGETVVISSAAGAVGSLAGQLAKQSLARVVGIAGTDDKCAYLIEELGFDGAINHRNPNFQTRLAEVCPRGVDVYLESVGGKVWEAVFPLLNRWARVPVCGLISAYADPTPYGGQLAAADTFRYVLMKSLEIKGYFFSDYEHLFQKFLDSVTGLVSGGEYRYREDIVEGLENAPLAFVGLFQGSNFGKLLVKVAG